LLAGGETHSTNWIYPWELFMETLGTNRTDNEFIKKLVKLVLLLDSGPKIASAKAVCVPVIGEKVSSRNLQQKAADGNSSYSDVLGVLFKNEPVKLLKIFWLKT